jgi:hypothetical protein
MNDARRIKELLRERVAEVAQYLYRNGHGEGVHWCVASIEGEPGKSFKICIAGPKAGLWGDFADSQKHSCNLVNLWMAARNVDFKNALREAADWLGYPLHGSNSSTQKASFAAPGVSQRVIAGGEDRKSGPSFDWQLCIKALRHNDRVRLGNERWYSRAFVDWLHRQRLVGLYQCQFAFPVHDRAGNVVAAHFKHPDGTRWLYYPIGTTTRPLVIGQLVPGDNLHVFESQWDAFAFMDVSGKRSGIIITRGAQNGKLIAGLVPTGATVYAWKQNDELKNGKRAGDEWLKDLAAHAGAKVIWPKTPEQFKDLNDWTRAGATPEDLVAAVVNAEVVCAFERFAGSAGGQELENKKPFPLGSLPPLVEAMAKEVCATERVPESLVGCCALGILSASIGAGLVVRSASNRVTRGNIYLLASAESGSGKSETFRHMAKPFQQFEMDRIKRWKELERPNVIAMRELLEVDIKKCKKEYAKQRHDDIGEEVKKFELEREELQKRLDPPTLSCEDVTTEKLADLLSKNDEQLASLSADALSTVNILLGRYNKLDRTDESLYLKTFSGDPCMIHRMSRDPISLESPCLTALWLTQPDKLQSLLDERSLNEGGLIARILACHTNCEPREIGKNPPLISISVEKAYAGLIFCLLETYRLADERFTIEPTSDALGTLNEHHDAIVKRRRGELSDVTSYAARWNEQAWRIAVCLHAGTHGGQAHEQPVSLETAQRAIALADWFAEEQLRILNAGRMERKAARLKKLKELIIECYNGAATLRDLDKSNNFKQDEVRELASRFPDILVIEKRVTGGRPSEIVRITQK